MSCPFCGGGNPSCPSCRPLERQDKRYEYGSLVRYDKPHGDVGIHVDVATPLSNGIPGVQKLRIGETGNILDEDFSFKKTWYPLKNDK